MAVLTVAVALTLGICEVALRLFYPRSDRYLVLPANEHTQLTPDGRYVTGVNGTADYRTSSWGIRGDEFGVDGSEYRILAVGGSTTHNVYLDQSETWTLLLKELLGQTTAGLPTWAGDIGASGRTTRSHVLQIEYLLPHLPRIDAVVMLVGVNDLTTALRQGFEYESPPPLSDPSARRDQMAQAFVQVPGRLHDRLTMYDAAGVSPIKRLALYQLVRNVKLAYDQSRSGLTQDAFGEIYVTWRRHRAEAARLLDSLPDLTRPLEEYQRYLQAIVASARNAGVRLLFMTQPTLWRADLSDAEQKAIWLGGIGDFQNEPGHAYFTPRVLAHAMAAYNETLMEVCRVESVECVDVAAAVPRDLTFFYDDVHFTERGSRLVGEEVAKHFKRLPPYAAERDSPLATPDREAGSSATWQR